MNYTNYSDGRIHEESSVPVDSSEKLQAMEQVVSHFLNTDIYSEEEILLNITIQAEDYQNPYAYMRLAEWYRNGVYVEQSDKEYAIMMKNALACEALDDIKEIMMELYDDETSGSRRGVIANISVDEWKAGSLLGDIGYKLGQYYANYNDRESLHKAEEYYGIAKYCLFDVEASLKRLAERLGRTGRDEVIHDFNRQGQENCVPDNNVQYSTNTFENVAQKALQTASQTLSKEFSREDWDKLTEQTRIYITTALFSYEYLVGVGDGNYRFVDFAPCVSLLMRGLEYELRLRFFKGYLDYLKDRYSDVEDYMIRNHMERTDLPDTRKPLIWKNRRGKLRYTDYERFSHLFTLGSLKSVVGFENTNTGDMFTIDATAVKYCLRCLMKPGWDYRRTMLWLRDICNSVEELRVMRNNASHGGTVLTERDATYAFEQMIFTQKLIEKLVSACR